ncbi:MAG TPA: DUF4231 domain-containing protein [Terracidiphilus sp.]|nr:DUF4231 domain-containing protein [Terracidiphilus sp.]
MASKVSSSPPRPRLVVQIGVTGHRPNRISADVAATLPGQCEQVLKAIAEFASRAYDPLLYSAQPPLLRVLSPLAEGADRMVAHAGLALGADLQCPFPFHVEEYCRDFTSEGSLQEFHALAAKASAVFECDGDRGAESLAYERIGRMVLEQSDFLIAVWDGEAAAGRGGTTQIVDEALEQSIPVVWLNAVQERPPAILLIDESGERQEVPLEELDARFASRFSQSDGNSGNDFNFGHAYCAEHQPRFDFGRLFRIFRDGLAKGKRAKGKWEIADFEPSARAEWTKMISEAPAPPEATRTYLLDRLCPHYAWADGLSGYYAGLLRSSALSTSLLSALAVLVAMLGMLGHAYRFGGRRVPALAEFALIAIILLITWHGRRTHWHERWLNYRQLAELLRQYCYLSPLGCPLATPPLPAHFSSVSDRSWVDGMFRAIARDLGLAPAVVDQPYLASIGKLIEKILDDQIGYHEGNSHTMEKLSHRLHHIGTSLFVITLLACIVHVFTSEESYLLLILATVPPAFGAAFYAIASQGEFARTADRSRAMAIELKSLQTTDLKNALDLPSENFVALREAAQRIAGVMIAETMDWSFVFRYRALNLPG